MKAHERRQHLAAKVGGRIPQSSLRFHQPKVKRGNVGNSHKYRKKENSLFMFLSFTPTHPRDARTRAYACLRGVGGEKVKPDRRMVPSRRV